MTLKLIGSNDNFENMDSWLQVADLFQKKLKYDKNSKYEILYFVLDFKIGLQPRRQECTKVR